MSYDIDFRVKVEGLEDRYVSVGECDANITWNLREMIVKSTGLEWKNERNNGEIDKGKEKTLTMLPIAHPLK